MKINTIPLPPLGANCTLLTDDNNNLIMIDPGGSAEKLIELIESEGYKLQKILCTHGHFDHIGAIADLVDKYKVPVYISKNDEALLAKASESSNYFGLGTVKPPKATDYLKDGDEIIFDDQIIEVLTTPGHTKGGVCFYIKSINSVITGDTLFRGSVGRTDFPGGSMQEITASIKTKLYRLPDNTRVFPGHGETSTISYEKKHNPFVNGN